MPLPSFRYLAPVTLDETLGLLARFGGDLAVLAGGTEIIGRLKQRLTKPESVVSLRNVPNLSGIRTEGAEMVIGPMTTLRELAQSPVVARVSRALSVAADSVAAPPIRNIATIGGNILQNTRCLYYNQSEFVRKAAEPCIKAGGNSCLTVKGSRKCFSVYQGDLAPALICSGAKAKIEKSGKSRVCTVAELFTGIGESPFSVEESELLTEIRVPIPAGTFASSFKKLRLRGSLDYPLASASVFFSFANGSIEEGKIVVGASAASPVVVTDAVKAVKGKLPDQVDADEAGELAAKAVVLADNLGLPASYRKKIIKVLTARAIREVIAQSGKAGL